MNLELEFNDRYQKALSETPVEFEIDPIWKQNAKAALRFASPISLGIKSSELRNIYDNLVLDKPLNCWEFAILSNNMESRTSIDLEMDNYSEYITHMEQAAGYTDQWNVQTKDLRDVILAELSKKQPKLPVKPMASV